jgi:hypothetical protein
LDYPEITFSGEFEADDLWANRVWLIGSTNWPPWHELPPDRATWYHHFLDDRTCGDGASLLAHRRSPTAATPPPFDHPHRPGHLIRPWIDLYAYWQAYHVAEILTHLHVAAAPRLPAPRAQLESLLREIDDLERRAQRDLQRLKERWTERQRTFDWISRYRTLFGIWRARQSWLNRPSPWSELEEGARRLGAELGLNPDHMRHQIRDHLLVLWREWSPAGPSAPARALLQADIAIALQFVRLLNGQPEDPEDDFWTPHDRQPRRWATLRDALPSEEGKARRRLPREAAAELARSGYHKLAPAHLRLDRDTLQILTDRWWPESVALRRFGLALQRLTDHNFGQVNEQHLVQLVEQTPIEFLILCALHAERLLTERFAPREGASLRQLLDRAAARFADVYGIVDKPGFLAEFGRGYKKSKLNDLPQNPGNPFTAPAHFPHAEPLVSFWVSTLANVAVMRNYAAHHDCIDEQLFSHLWVGIGVEALVVTIFVTLATEPPAVPPSGAVRR